MRKFNGYSNISGEIIECALSKQKMTQEQLCRELQLRGINIDRFHLYRIMKREVILKDFEFIAICSILKIDYSKLEDIVNDNK